MFYDIPIFEHKPKPQTLKELLEEWINAVKIVGNGTNGEKVAFSSGKIRAFVPKDRQKEKEKLIGKWLII